MGLKSTLYSFKKNLFVCNEYTKIGRTKRHIYFTSNLQNSKNTFLYSYHLSNVLDGHASGFWQSVLACRTNDFGKC